MRLPRGSGQLWKVAPKGVPVLRNTGPGDWVEKWRDPKSGRWVHNYTLATLAKRAGEKFAQNLAFARQLPAIRAQVQRDLRAPGLRGVVALAVALIDRTYFRVGNEESCDNGVYGVTTLLRRHLSIRGDTVTFDFVGKKRVEQHKVLCDGVLAAALRRLHHGGKPSEARLFQHDGRPLDAELVNDYLRPFGVTAKQFRTYHATRLAREYLLRFTEVAAPERAGVVRAMFEDVAAALGHTPAVCRASYVDPAVTRAFEQGKLR